MPRNSVFYLFQEKEEWKIGLVETFMPDKAKELRQRLHAWRASLQAPLATPNPQYDPRKQHLLDPEVEEVRQRYLPMPWPPETQ